MRFSQHQGHPRRFAQGEFGGGRGGDFFGGGRGMRGGPGGPGGPRGGGGRRRVFDAGELRLVLLRLIADQPRHGYDLIRAIEDRTGGAYAPSPGVIYPTITMLQDMGHIDEVKAEGARKAFAISTEGSAHLAERQAEAEALLERLDQLGTVARKTDGGPVKRATMNLRAVLHQRLHREDVPDDMLHDIAAIIDEAARRIERLKQGGDA
ncbi:PadR family transcriptional regulator [Sphingomonas solaris]|nr:PadR family transcriptional regulator [Sphingomonas solaris]